MGTEINRRVQPRIAQFAYGPLPFFLLIFLIFAVVYRYFSEHTVFPISKVVVIDDTARANPKTLKSIILPYVQQGFLKIDLSQLQQALGTSPWIKKAAITREWPDRLVIRLTENQPFVVWNKEHFLTSEGTEFTPQDLQKFSKDLPQLQAPKEKRALALKNYLTMSKILLPLKLNIVQLVGNEQLSWTVYLNNNLVVNLGSEDPIAKLSEFVKVYPQVFNGTKKADYVDMRYRHGMAVRWIN